jgi:hypothetical protein
MKRLVLLIPLLAAGCFSHKLPPDSYMRGVKSEINTPWGSHKLDIQEAGTGTAAINASSLKP